MIMVNKDKDCTEDVVIALSDHKGEIPKLGKGDNK